VSCDHGQEVSAFDARGRGYGDTLDGARNWSGDGDLHLHRLDGGDSLPGLHLIACADVDGDDTGERGGDVTLIGSVGFSR
jgi:hypothetical protein